MTAVAANAFETVRSPEGVELRFVRASASERAVALVIDLGILVVAMLVWLLVSWWLFGAGGVLLAAFFLRHGYFTFFETKWNGRTPGKRLFHLRVIRTDGGPLTIETLLARNLTREVELFLPLTLIFVPDALFFDHEGVVRLLASVWVLLLLFFPLTNRHRVRIGDLLAGTRVVVSPPARLLGDLADGSVHRRFREEPGPGDYRFTKEQLSIYGEHELTVLEDVLRKAPRRAENESLAVVAASICKRIRHAPLTDADQAGPFLRAFYRAQRQQLEQQLLLGQRRLRQSGKQRPTP